MEQTRDYMVVARVGKVDYLVKVEAYSCGGAEHKVLDKVDASSCLAFSEKDMKTEYARNMVFHAEPISMMELLLRFADK